MELIKEELWMGIPIVIKKDNRLLSHAGETTCVNQGLEVWIMKSDDD
ncbi:MAG: hypothetical protein P8M15_02725 [Alphaproteobacteria bacterium]|nr:hypothetical protein [Alphaproteobacteria bacterium]|tara:strand:+ start:313 stop:453 length:141 start_codon:yes stop_codon:yes gene_type:complete